MKGRNEEKANEKLLDPAFVQRTHFDGPLLLLTSSWREWFLGLFSFHSHFASWLMGFFFSGPLAWVIVPMWGRLRAAFQSVNYPIWVFLPGWFNVRRSPTFRHRISTASVSFPFPTHWLGNMNGSKLEKWFGCFATNSHFEKDTKACQAEIVEAYIGTSPKGGRGKLLKNQTISHSKFYFSTRKLILAPKPPPKVTKTPSWGRQTPHLLSLLWLRIFKASLLP